MKRGERSAARDRALGMNRLIDRRDFLNGAAVALGAMLERRSGADSHRRLSRFRLANQRIAHLEQLDRLFGPQPGRQAKPVVLVEDDGPIHRSVGTCAAGAATQGACRPSG